MKDIIREEIRSFLPTFGWYMCSDSDVIQYCCVANMVASVIVVGLKVYFRVVKS